jgi:hypothetical protein
MTTTRTGTDGITTAEEKIHAAVEQLKKVGEVKKTAGLITDHAAKIERTCTAITTGIDRLLAEALTALSTAETEPAPRPHVDNAVA